jgi:ABC-type multidrug transport system, ATPase and permease components
MYKELAGKTIVVVAQRVATIMNADKIVVMDKGCIVAEGTHQELLESCEIYQEIYETQTGLEDKGGRGFMKKKKKRSSFVRLMRYLGRDMRMVTVILVMLTLSTAFDIFAPKVVQGITDSIKLFDGIEFDWDYLTRQLIILALLYILVGVCLAISKKALVKIAENTVFSLRQRMQKKLEVMSLNYLDTHKRGDILARATSDMVMVTNMLETNLSSMFVKLLTIAGILLMMFVTSVKLAAYLCYYASASVYS